MLKWIFGIVVGGLAAYAYYSEQAREQIRQQFASANPSLREGVATVASATTAGLQRVSQVVDSTPLPPQAKDRARSATAAIQSAADRVTQQAGGSTDRAQPPTPPSGEPVLKALIPDEVLAEQDAASRAAAAEQQERLTGA